MSHLNETLQVTQILHFTNGNVLQIDRMVFDLMADLVLLL